MSLFQQIESEYLELKDIINSISFRQRQLEEYKANIHPPTGSVTETQLLQWREMNKQAEAYIQNHNKLIEDLKLQYNAKFENILSLIPNNDIWLSLNDRIHVCKESKNLRVYEGDIALFKSWRNKISIQGTDHNKHLKIYYPK